MFNTFFLLLSHDIVVVVVAHQRSKDNEVLSLFFFSLLSPLIVLVKQNIVVSVDMNEPSIIGINFDVYRSKFKCLEDKRTILDWC